MRTGSGLNEGQVFLLAEIVVRERKRRGEDAEGESAGWKPAPQRVLQAGLLRRADVDLDAAVELPSLGRVVASTSARDSP